MKIGFILKELRSLKGVSQQQIADLLNVERSTYCKWETDHNWGLREVNFALL